MTITTPVRLAGATHFLPSEDEWYKAAYYEPGSASTNGDDCWQYPTQSDSAPTGEVPPGRVNSANFNSQGGGLTAVGAYTLTTSHYGAFDMGGNVWEWNEAIIPFLPSPLRGLRGGSWDNNVINLHSSDRGIDNPALEVRDVGIRIASIPEPATSGMVSIALATLGWRRRR